MENLAGQISELSGGNYRKTQELLVLCYEMVTNQTSLTVEEIAEETGFPLNIVEQHIKKTQKGRLSPLQESLIKEIHRDYSNEQLQKAKRPTISGQKYLEVKKKLAEVQKREEAQRRKEKKAIELSIQCGQMLCVVNPDDPFSEFADFDEKMMGKLDAKLTETLNQETLTETQKTYFCTKHKEKVELWKLATTYVPDAIEYVQCKIHGEFSSPGITYAKSSIYRAAK